MVNSSPFDLAEELPAPRHARSRFIVEALREKVARRESLAGRRFLYVGKNSKPLFRVREVKVISLYDGPNWPDALGEFSERSPRFTTPSTAPCRWPTGS